MRVPEGTVAPRPEEVEVLGAFATEDTRSHAEAMAPGLRDLLAAADVAGTDLDLVLTGVGPGPFTGLRAGIMTARTLGWAWNVPVRGMMSLDAVAQGAADDARSRGIREFLVATDARRREVYAAAYRLLEEDPTAPGGPGRATGWERIAGPVVGPASTVRELLGPEIEAEAPTAGRGSLLYPEDLPPLPGHQNDQPLAAHLVRAAVRRGLGTDWSHVPEDRPGAEPGGRVPGLAGTTTAGTSPLYLRESDARVPGARKKAAGTSLPAGEARR